MKHFIRVTHSETKIIITQNILKYLLTLEKYSGIIIVSKDERNLLKENEVNNYGFNVKV